MGVRTGGGGFRRLWIVLARRRVAGWCIGLAAAAAGLGVVLWEHAGVRRLGPALTASLPALIVLLTGTIGVWMVYIGWPRRVGRGAHCAACGYYQENQGKITGSCPECGAPWRWIGNTKPGKPVGSTMLVVLGMLLWILAGMAVVVPAASPSVMLRIMPSSALLAQLGTLPDSTLVEAWAELDRRRIPAKKLEELAEALLKKQARDGYLSSPAERVLFEAAMVAPANSALSQQYFMLSLRADLEAPLSELAGGTVTVSAPARFAGRAMVLNNQPRVVVLSALYVGDDPEPVDTWEWDVRPDVARVQERTFVHRIEEVAVGRLRLRQKFWLVVGPGGQGIVTWSKGEPVLPGTLQIKDQIEATREVMVTRPPKSPEPRE